MARSKSSQRWMQEHLQDAYVKKAQTLGLRSRAVFKLMEIQEKDQIIQPGMTVIDLGAAPGGWSEYVRQTAGKHSKIIALDMLAMDPVEGVEFIQGDFTQNDVLEQLYQVLDNAPAQLILSDMAPNLSGNKVTDQPRAIYLGELALDVAKTVLNKRGTLLMKMFQGAGFETLLNDVKSHFTHVALRKPKSSRPRSKEVYILAKGFK